MEYQPINTDIFDKNNYKYIVYENDLKYKTMRDLDVDRIIWNNEIVQKMFREENLDTLQYRLNECEKKNYEYVDLKQLNLTQFPLLDKQYKQIKHLFLGDNKLEKIPCLIDFNKLETLEITHN